jgi:hypothetical protein
MSDETLPKVLTDEERRLWGRFFRWVTPVASEYNQKTWPIDASTPIDTAQYIGTFCYGYQALRSGWLLNSKKQRKKNK